jgi:hypothetical protein
MRRPCWFAALAVLALGLLIPSDALAQFNTPSRAFHNSTTRRLDGKHQAVPCLSCHLNGQFNGTPKNCVECHWIRRRDDPYQLRLGSQCDSCHRPSGWTAVNWNHAAQAGVPLNAQHRTLPCMTCHKDGDFRRTSASQCVSCHQKDYTGVKEPNHVAAGFPTTCDTCHKATSVSWSQATFAHAFPRTGNHNVRCSQCHSLPNTFAVYACITCHSRDTDDRHTGVNGYRYESTACFACHPNGRKT